LSVVAQFTDELKKHRTIVWALLMRELSTRYGRNNIGFLWLVAEPLIFSTGVAVLWTWMRPPYEFGVQITAFVITGYLPLILIRQMINYSVGGVKNNSGLLFHRMVTPLHLLATRSLIEFIGVTLSACLCVFVYHMLGILPLPRDFSSLGYVYAGWFTLGLFSFGVGMTMGALAEIFEFTERFVSISTYLLIPLSGAFWPATALPPGVRQGVLAVPVIHNFEMIRHGFFGVEISTYFSLPYAVAGAVIATLIGVALVQYVRDRVEVD
jgi:capsular polysaccharide transport system permease protein